MEVNLETKYRKWYREDCFYSIGYAFVNDELLEGKRLCEYVKECIKSKRITEALQQSNGCFAIICFVEDRAYLIVDKLRSYPLLYTTKNNHFIIADSANGFEDSIGSYLLDELSTAEFLSLGYLSGNRTVLKDVFNVEAGSYVVIDKDEVVINLYDEHISKKQDFQDEILMENSSRILEEAFGRMLKIIGNKQLVIPLSGGYDSRLILCLCKKMHIQNVLCFTYGRKDSFEVAISEKVANTLGYDWCFIEYTPEVINKWINNPIWDKYINYVGNFNVNPSVQGLFALLELRDRKIVNPENAVFIPGHSGDALGGSHMLPLNIMKRKSLEDVLFEKYYTQNSLHIQWRNKVRKMLQENIGQKMLSVDEKYDRHYSWNVRNRQANFIVNSARTFEFIGSNWCIPLWDAEYSAFWNSVSWEKKREKIYNKFMFECYFCKMDVDFIKYSPRQSMAKKIVSSLLPQVLKEYIHICVKHCSKAIVQPNFNSFDIMVDSLKCSSHVGYCREVKNDIDSTLSRYYLDFILSKL